MIEVTQTGGDDPLEFKVIVREGAEETHHEVTMGRDLHGSLAAGHAPEACVDAVFRFLLDREPKESILRRFDVAVVSRYFPEFEDALPRYLDRS